MHACDDARTAITTAHAGRHAKKTPWGDSKWLARIDGRQPPKPPKAVRAGRWIG